VLNPIKQGSDSVGCISPNILMIIPDQQRYDCIGYSNDYPVETPNIDNLASQGVWFTNAYTPIPLCCPARQALLNGRRPEAFGALWNYDIALKIPALEPVSYTRNCLEEKLCHETTDSIRARLKAHGH
jgi:arylsulfatase A-like enzyme